MYIYIHTYIYICIYYIEVQKSTLFWIWVIIRVSSLKNCTPTMTLTDHFPFSFEDVCKETLAQKMLNFTWCCYNSLPERKVLLQSFMVIEQTHTYGARNLIIDCGTKLIFFHGRRVVNQNLFKSSPAAYIWQSVNLSTIMHDSRFLFLAR